MTPGRMSYVTVQLHPQLAFTPVVGPIGAPALIGSAVTGGRP